MEITDPQILVVLKSDRQQGFKLLFDRYYRPMCVFGSKYIRDLDVVEDIVQDILIHVWNQSDFERFTGLKAYLFTSVKNKCLSTIKKEKLLHLDDLNIDWEKDLFLQDDSKEEIEKKVRAVEEAISELSPACQEVFKMVAIDRLKYREVADDLDISVNTVKTQMKKAYRIINSKLQILFLLVLYS